MCGNEQKLELHPEPWKKKVPEPEPHTRKPTARDLEPEPDSCSWKQGFRSRICVIYTTAPQPCMQAPFYNFFGLIDGNQNLSIRFADWIQRRELNQIHGTTFSTNALLSRKYHSGLFKQPTLHEMFFLFCWKSVSKLWISGDGFLYNCGGWDFSCASAANKQRDYNSNWLILTAIMQV